MRYNKDQRLFMVEKYHKLKNYTLVQRAWRTNFKNYRVPKIDTIKNTIRRLNDTGSVVDTHRLREKPSQKRQDAIEFLKDKFSADPTLSIRQASSSAEVSYGMVQSILKEDLHLKPYKLHEWHQLLEGDYKKRLDFADFFMDLPKNALSRLICCDEAYFYLTRQINSQNDRMWLESKPTDKIERPLQDQKVLVWCAISCGQTYGPYFFEESVNQHNYLEMLKKFFYKKHCQMPNYNKNYFLQDGATPHTANMVQDYLKSKFLSRFFDKDKWPPRSPDLNPCDFFLWGYLKKRVYNPLPDSLDSLKANIVREFTNIPKKTLKSTFDEFYKRLEKLKINNGAHVEEK